MARGGKRAGSGRKKGSVLPATLHKDQAREALRLMVTAHLKPIFEAQLANAVGLKHFFKRDEKGQFVRINDPDVIEASLNAGDEKAYWIHVKDPSVESAKVLLDRALDKPAEHVNLAGHDGGPLIVKWKA